MIFARQIPLAAIILGVLAAVTSAHAVPIRFLPWDDAIAARKIAFSDGTDVTELKDLHPHKRSKTLKWTAGEVPPVLVALDRTSPDGKPVTAPIKFTAGMTSPLVLILPDAAAPSGLRCFVIEDSSGRFGWGTLRFINATGRDLLIREDKAIKPLPKTWTAVDISPGGQKRNIGIQMASPADLKAILYSSVWEHDPDVRKLIIVVPGTDAGSGAVDLKIIPEDRRSVAAAVPETASQAP